MVSTIDCNNLHCKQSLFLRASQPFTEIIALAFLPIDTKAIKRVLSKHHVRYHHYLRNVQVRCDFDSD